MHEKSKRFRQCQKFDRYKKGTNHYLYLVDVRAHEDEDDMKILVLLKLQLLLLNMFPIYISIQ